MTSSRIIEVLVTPTGETRIETKGFAGSTCRDASSFLEQALGQRVQEELTSEFHTEQSAGQRLHEGS